MKSLFYITLFFSILFCYSCQSTNEIYIVRHGEKTVEPVNDPLLTTEGKQRAEILKDLLKDKKIKAIYSTQRTRSKETAKPLSNLLNIPVQIYGNDTLPAFIRGVIGLKKNALIVGHSNTSVTMISSLNLPHTVTFIPEDDFDNMFIIKVKGGRAVKITETTYGTISPVK